jgi:hypothetical protein
LENSEADGDLTLSCREGDVMRGWILRSALASLALLAARHALAESPPEVIAKGWSPSCEVDACDEQVVSEYLLGKELFAGRLSPSLSVDERGTSQLSAIRDELPAEGKEAVDRLDGRLSESELRALLFYLRARFGVSVKSVSP